MSLWHSIGESIYQSTGEMFSIDKRDAIGGGCINESYRISNGKLSYFVKINKASLGSMFDAEFKGLNEMAASGTVRVPIPLVVGQTQSQAYLVMEFIAMGGKSSDELFGRQLADMHRHSAQQFGWVIDNTIGSTAQINTQADDWVSFWQAHRLGFQLELAARRGAGPGLIDGGKKLIELLPVFFSDYTPVPSLLHGDLWGGNYSSDTRGNPVIYDPACYYGDREADIAMTELFGGFGSQFYSSYNNCWPLADGYKVRRTLYNVYHILNHFNLFGGGYSHQAERMINSLLAQAK